MSNQKKGLLFALCSAALYGLIPILGKKFVTDFPPLFAAFTVVLLAGVFIGIVAFWRKEIFKNLTLKNIFWVAVLGFFAAIGSIFAFLGLSVGRASEAGFIFQLETFFAAILAFLLLKEKLSQTQVGGLVFMFVGAYVLSTSVSFSFEVGNLFFLGSAFVWGINDIIVKSRIRHSSSFFLAFGRNFFSLFILLPLALQYFPESLQKTTGQDMFLFLLYGLIVAGTIVCLYLAISYLKTAEATSYQLTSPILTAVIAFFIFGEYLSGIEFIGAMLILGGLFLMGKRL
ncbi:MAG: hypothetical protein ACD_50C00083G0001 [uncultured bacterium]|nr:MAG: hypothetical protein ACD_50C00083G0001 [uncultured bacterium]OGH13194.1 MAG: hypothetical protein A2687_00645 [Candidatus Levybacteria bacterium RIFCSPHIGHO2_01_FULL_38_26]